MGIFRQPPMPQPPRKIAAVVPPLTSAQTISGVSRVQKSVDAAQPGLSRLTASVDRTQTGVADIRNTTERTQAGLARLRKSVDQTIPGTGRVQKSVDQTQAGLARLRKSVDQTIPGTGRVQKSVAQTTTGVAKIIRERDYSWEARASLPANAATLANVYSLAEIDDTATLDLSYVLASGTTQFLIHLFKNLMTGSETSLGRRWTGSITRPASVDTVYLQIYNFTNAIWETVDSETSAASPVTLSGIVSANLANYYDPFNITAWRVYQEVL